MTFTENQLQCIARKHLKVVFPWYGDQQTYFDGLLEFIAEYERLKRPGGGGGGSGRHICPYCTPSSGGCGGRHIPNISSTNQGERE